MNLERLLQSCMLSFAFRMGGVSFGDLSLGSFEVALGLFCLRQRD